MSANKGFGLEAYQNAVNEYGSVSAAARALGVRRCAIQKSFQRAGITVQDDALDGVVRNKKPVKMALPAKGKVKRYLLTCAQNNTGVNTTFLRNLEVLAEYYEADIMVSRVTYNKARYGNKSVKPGTHTADDNDDLWYDPAISPYICDDRVQLAPGLVFVGDMNILPTAARPLSGLEGFTKTASGVFPHTKIAMEPVPTPAARGAKHNYTTGAVTKLNYVQKKAGQKAEFHHAYGALLVEVESDGSWWVRHINADGKNRIYDIDVCVDGGELYEAEPAEALTPGDIHASEIDHGVKEVIWGEGGVIDVLRPKHQFWHDLFSMRSRSHHEMRDFHRMMEKHVNKEGNVRDELVETMEFCHYAHRDFCKAIVVRSNHDEALDRWLRDADYRDDLENAEFFLDAQRAIVKAMRKGHYSDFNVLEWALRYIGLKTKVRFLEVNEPFETCKRYGGIENGLHGDKGPGGSRGSRQSFTKLARRLIVGHSHSAGIQDGVYQVGTSSLLNLPYVKGPSPWSHTFCITYANSKRTLCTICKGKPWADRSALN